MRQARSIQSTRVAFAACVVLCLTGLAAGCSHDGSAPSTTAASTRPAEPQETAESAQTKERPATGQPSSTGATRTEGDSHAARESLYALQPTLRCLERHPRLAATTRPTTVRLRALRDLAQRTSVVAQLDGANVGVAVVQSSAHAVLLAELLRAPEDPHRIIRRRNAVLLFLPRARSAFEVVADCLRPAG